MQGMRLHRGRHLAALALALALALATITPGMASSAGAGTQTPPGPSQALEPRIDTAKAALASQPVDPSNRSVIVKFREGTGVRLNGGSLTSSTDVSGVTAVLAKYPGTTVARLFRRPAADLAQEKARVESRTRRQQADLNLYFRLVAPEGADVAALIADLNALPVVEAAYSEPKAVAPPVTPDFTGQQGYRQTAPGGIGADLVSALPGGKGQNITIADIEYSWNVDHEDLAKARLAGALIANGTPDDPFDDNDHGTAVLGEIVGDENAFGVTGIVSAATLRLVNANTTGGYDLANAISLATGALAAGDVILIEQQTTGPNGGCDAVSQVGCAPVEWVQAFYDAIVLATGAGIIVVEAAGNGTQDLDSAPYNPLNARTDSGAIMVGAGGAPGCTAPARGRLDFSNFGARVNLQGWGECVVTTGYGDLQGGADPNVWYTDTFGGTSSASPIVAGAAGVVSSIAQQRGVTLTPQQVRTLLRDTGTPQELGMSALTGNIGPLPNLFRATQSFSCSTPPPATITAVAGVITIGTPGDDVIMGTGGADRMAGMGGNDTVIGGGGDDELQGGEGNDTLCGGAGNDRITGGNGNDHLQGDGQNDDLTGGANDDVLLGGSGVDRLTGDAGTDRCLAGGQVGDVSAPAPLCDILV